MNSGKQVSFQNGEVSPSLQYRSDLASYATGLSRLKNFYVRRAGGVSNRSGFKFIKVHEYQGTIPEGNSFPAITGAVFKSNFNGSSQFVEYYGDNSVAGNTLSRNAVPFYSPGLSTGISSPKVHLLRFTPYNAGALLTPALNVDTVGTGNLTLDMSISTPTFRSFAPFTFFVGLTSITCVASGSTSPLIPASYIFYGVTADGREDIIAEIQDPGSVNRVVQPLGDRYNTITIVTAAALDLTYKFVDIYRAVGGTATTSKFYKLAGRVPAPSGTTLSFLDYGFEDASRTPPQDFELNGAKGALSLTSAKTASYYQQRLLLSYDTQVVSGIRSGEIGASKLGAPEMIRMPLIYNPVGAFKFNIPVEDGTPVVATLSMERLIAFTEKAVYVVRGGEQGALTPTEVNPVRLAEVGCSRTVEPKIESSVGYFLNFDHTRLMGIVFGEDGNLGVVEMSYLADHLLGEEVHKIEAIDGSVYMVRKDGKVVQVNFNSGVPGFSLIETEGFIENVFATQSFREYVPFSHDSRLASDREDTPIDTIGAYVIRNGVRFLEELSFREDEFDFGMNFVDGFINVGLRPSRDTLGRYAYRRPAPDGFGFLYDAPRSANIVGGTDWTPDETLTVDVFAPGPVSDTLVFYYENEFGKIKPLYFTITATVAPVTPGYDIGLEGNFSDTVPPELRDAENNPNTSLYEKRGFLTRWVEANDTFATPHNSQEMAVFADGEVIASTIVGLISTDGSGMITLPKKVGYATIGLPYESDFETLDLEAGDGRTFTDQKKLLNAVGVAFLKTRGGRYGIEDQTLDNMDPLLAGEDEALLEQPSYNGHKQIHIPSQWSERGRIRIRQAEPLPMSILAVYPKGMIGG